MSMGVEMRGEVGESVNQSHNRSREVLDPPRVWMLDSRDVCGWTGGRDFKRRDPRRQRSGRRAYRESINCRRPA